MSVKNATMHEKRTTAQKNFSEFRTLKRPVFPAKYNVLKLSDQLTSSCKRITVRVNDDSSFAWLFGTGTCSQVVGVKHTTIKNLKWQREILFRGHAVHGRRHTGEFCHIR